MTHPLTPREKVARAIQAHDNDHVPDGYASGLSDEVSDWSAYLADRVLTALASGSGDHAELARLINRLRAVALDYIGKVDRASCIETEAADALEARIAEVAALRANEKAALKECSEWARKAGEAIGRLETSEAAGIVEGWRDRATEAERKLAEAVGHVEQLVDRLHSIRDSSIVLIAARTFLSKEAERG